MSFLRQNSPVAWESWAGFRAKCPWLQGQVESTAGACLALAWAPTWGRTHLEGVQHNEDIGPNDAEGNEEPTQPGEPQHGQQHQDGFGRGPGGRKSSGLSRHISEMKHHQDRSCGTNSSGNKIRQEKPNISPPRPQCASPALHLSLQVSKKGAL